MKTKTWALILITLMAMSVRAEEYITFTKKVTLPKSKVVGFALRTGWQEKLSETVQQEREVTESATRMVDTGELSANGDPLMVPENYEVTRTVTENVVIETPNPITAAEWADSKVGAALVEYMSQFSVNDIVAQKEVEKQAEVKAAREEVAASVTTVIEE